MLAHDVPDIERPITSKDKKVGIRVRTNVAISIYRQATTIEVRPATPNLKSTQKQNPMQNSAAYADAVRLLEKRVYLARSLHRKNAVLIHTRNVPPIEC